MSTFTWTPSWSTAIDEEPRVLKAMYGDGYMQRAQDGINTVLKKWNVVFTDQPPVTAGDIRTFLKSHGGVTNFDWTDPDGDAGKYICSKWSRSFDDYGGQSIKAMFEEVPE